MVRVPWDSITDIKGGTAMSFLRVSYVASDWGESERAIAIMGARGKGRKLARDILCWSIEENREGGIVNRQSIAREFGDRWKQPRSSLLSVRAATIGLVVWSLVGAWFLAWAFGAERGDSDAILWVPWVLGVNLLLLVVILVQALQSRKQATRN